MTSFNPVIDSIFNEMVEIRDPTLKFDLMES